MVRNLIPVLALAFAPLFAGEGVVVIQKQEDLQGGSAANQKMQIEQDKVASKRPTAPSGWALSTWPTRA